MSRKFLYRRLGSAVIVILGFLAVMAPPSAAQDKPELKRPQQTPQEKLPEEKKPKKNVKGPRAVGVLQLTNSGKATLIPIAILIDGKFYDAGVYKADPVPMALESGTVYEAEQEGDSLGLFTISGALHSKTAGSPHPWLGAGSYSPRGTEAAKSTRKAEDVPVGLESSGGDAPPRLSRGGKSKPAAAPSPTPAPSSSTPSGAGSSGKPAPSGSPASSPPANGSSTGASSGQQQAPASTAGQQPPSGQTSQGQASQGQEAGNYYRPTLRRGKPTQSAPQEDEPALTDKTKTGKPESPAAAALSPEPMQLVAAISDAGGPDPRPYKFFWKTGEEDDRRKEIIALAASEVQAYANALAKNRIPARPPAAKPAAAASRRFIGLLRRPSLCSRCLRTFSFGPSMCG